MNKKKFILFFTVLFLIMFLFEQCQTTGKEVRLAEEPFEKLSQYNFFAGELKALQPNERVLPYDLITPLFTDYAEKSRFVWMPEGRSAQYVKDESFVFPEAPHGNNLVQRSKPSVASMS